MFTKFNLHPDYSSRFSVCQHLFVEFREHCRYAQIYRGVIVFYDRYVILCKKKGVAPSAAAVDAGISKSLVTKWKTNNIDVPSADVLKKLSAYFNVPVSELLEETEKAPTEKGERTVSDAELKFALWGDCEDVDDDDLADVRRYAAFVRERKKDRK